MAEYASVDDLLADVEGSEKDVALPSGRTVRVRGLSRFEWFLAGKGHDGEANVFETRIITMGMVSPAMSEKQVEAWRKRPGAMVDLGAVCEAIRKLTGIDEGADKSDL